MPDKRALKILFDYYWSSAGWRPESDRAAASEDLAYAKRAGVMFNPRVVHHDDVVAQVITSASRLSTRRVSDAFLSSLSTRRLDLRSALPTYAVFRHLTAHARTTELGACPVCGLYESDSEDLSVLNFERFKWGGVRHDDVLYGALDLELFSREPAPSVTSQDVDILRELIKAIDSAPPGTTSASLQQLFAPVFKSNKAERDVVVATLGFCGILRVPGRASYRGSFVSWSERPLPDRRFVDMAYPACWWRAADGVDHDALMEYFGHVL